MQLSRFVVYRDAVDHSHREEWLFEPPMEFEGVVGHDTSLWDDIRDAEEASTIRHVKRQCPPIVNTAGILHLRELVSANDSISVILRPKYRLNDLVLDPCHGYQLLADTEGLHYWFAAGRDGIFEITAQAIPDSDLFYKKLKSNPYDIGLRDYLAKRSLADSAVTEKALYRVPVVMTLKEAAQYIRVSTSALSRMAAMGQIRRTPHKRYRKAELDAYLNTDRSTKWGWGRERTPYRKKKPSA